MTSPVERLEQWCEEQEARQMRPGQWQEPKEFWARMHGYRRIIHEYHQAKKRYHANGEGDELGYEPVYDTWYTAVLILADTLNPERHDG